MSTLRIRNRARKWRALRLSEDQVTEALANAPGDKIEAVARHLEENTGGFMRARRQMLREPAHMRQYWRKQLLLWTCQLRANKIAQRLVNHAH